MKWFEGTIAEAVKVSKERNAIFTVFIEGKDQFSTKLSGFIEDRRISGKLEDASFVVIKVEGGSESYMQFASIYQIVPVPSLFFIGQSGSPLEIATGVIESVEELEKKVLSALNANGSSLTVQPTTVPETTITPSTSSVQESEVVCNDGVCQLKPKIISNEEEQSHPSTPPPTPVALQPPQLETAIPEVQSNQGTTQEQLKKRLEEIKVQKENENREQEKEREIQRRKDGKELQTFQEKQKEDEYRELKESIKREKKLEQEARQKILDQIANDRKERARKLDTQAPSTSTSTTNIQSTPKSTAIPSDSSKLQFRVPNGETHAHTFVNSTLFSEIRNYVKSTVLQGSGISNFSLVMTYPRKEFTVEDDTKTLLDLGLCPSGVILVIVKSGSAAKVIARTGGIANIFNTLFWGLLSPVFAVFGYFRRAVFGGGNSGGARAADTGAQKRANEEQISANDLAKKRNLDRFTGVGSSVAGPSTPSQTESTPYRRAGSNIHRLADQKDDDDDNMTWNGNSTQQQ
ncbi:UBXN4 family protein [Megaselia abdita]